MGGRKKTSDQQVGEGEICINMAHSGLWCRAITLAGSLIAGLQIVIYSTRADCRCQHLNEHTIVI